MRTLTWLWIAFLLLCFFADGTSYFLARARLSDALGLALDGALVAGVSEGDLMWGRNLTRRGAAENAARELLAANLGDYLAPRTMADIELSQSGAAIIAKGSLKTSLPLLLAGFIGQEGRINVSKSLTYQGVYR